MSSSLSINPVILPGRWCVHGYYTLNPFAPDQSGRFVIAGADLEKNEASVFVLDSDHNVLMQSPPAEVNSNFYHTGLWQTWSPDSNDIYYQAGSFKNPAAVKWDLTNDTIQTVQEADMEGAPPLGEPLLCTQMGMIYAAGYGDRIYHPDMAPVPFQQRDKHGIFEIGFNPPSNKLVLTVNDVLEQHPCRDQILEADRQVKSRLGDDDGLTLMLYCVRWNRQGTRLLFYFGNHCVVKDRKEPRLAYVMTADRDLKNIKLVADLSFGKPGAHWGWCPDGEHLLGYGPTSATDNTCCIATVHHTGKNYHKICTHSSGGHPSLWPANPNILVTDDYSGTIDFIDLTTDKNILQLKFPTTGKNKTRAPGRHPNCIDNHSVFNHDGSQMMINTLPDKLGMPMILDTANLFEHTEQHA